MELTFQSMEKIKTLQEELKTCTLLMELIVESMKDKENNYLIQSTHAIIKKKLT